MGFSRQEYWSGLPFPSPGNLPDPGIEPRSPALQTSQATLYRLSHGRRCCGVQSANAPGECRLQSTPSKQEVTVFLLCVCGVCVYSVFMVRVCGVFVVHARGVLVVVCVYSVFTVCLWVLHMLVVVLPSPSSNCLRHDRLINRDEELRQGT